MVLYMEPLGNNYLYYLFFFFFVGGGGPYHNYSVLGHKNPIPIIKAPTLAAQALTSKSVGFRV